MHFTPKIQKSIIIETVCCFVIGMDKLNRVYSKVQSLKSNCIQVDRKFQIQIIIIRK